MQTISIRQPWAWIIVHWRGSPSIPKKRIENRSKLKHIRGPHLIHAGQKLDKIGMHWLIDGIVNESSYTPNDQKTEFLNWLCLSMRSLKFGGIIGRMDIIDCYPDTGLWAVPGQNHLHLANVEPLPFMACPGRQGPFEVNYK